MASPKSKSSKPAAKAPKFRQQIGTALTSPKARNSRGGMNRNMAK